MVLLDFDTERMSSDARICSKMDVGQRGTIARVHIAKISPTPTLGTYAVRIICYVNLPKSVTNKR